MSRLTLLAMVILLAIPQLLATSPALGQGATDEQLARQFFETGRAYFERAEFERAAEAFAEAYALSPRPPLLINQARALEALGRYAEAVALLEQCLHELSPESDMRPSVESRLARLRAQQERAEREEAARAAAAAAAVAEGEMSAAPAASEPTAEAGRGAMWWSGLGSVSAGGALLVVALGTGLASANINDDLDANCPDGACPPEYADDIEKGERLAMTSTVTLSVGAAASVAGLLLMLLPRNDEAAPDSRGVEVTSGPGQIGAGMRLHF